MYKRIKNVKAKCQNQVFLVVERSVLLYKGKLSLCPNPPNKLRLKSVCFYILI